MKTAKGTSTFVIGLALFSMFFGGGNLIFPLFVGQISSGKCFFATIGFVIMGILAPLLAVIAMLLYKGDYTKFFSRLGKKGGFLSIAILLTVWIPLGSAPRCINLAYSSLASFFTLPPLWIFSIFYTGLLLLVCLKKGRILDILGYVLTPLLITCLAIVIFKGINLNLLLSSSPNTSASHLSLLFRGMKEGYNTMDLIASFFFSATIIGILRQNREESRALSQTLKSCLIAMILLGAIYIGLILLASSNVNQLQSIPKDQLLAYISRIILPYKLGLVSVTSIVLACFTTSVALIVVYTDFLNKSLFKKTLNLYIAMLTTLFFTFAMSLFKLEGITYITSPLLSIFYPLLIVLIFINCAIHLIKSRSKKSDTEPRIAPLSVNIKKTP